MDSRRLRRPNVLAVDDQPANLVALDAVLASEFEVVRASSGYQALEILKSRDDIDVILMDVQMPGMDGFEAAARVKQIPGCSDIPIAFITAVFHEDPFVKQGYDAGAVDYFTKPFNPEILKVKVGIYASFRQKSDLLKERERQIQAADELRRAGQQMAAMLETLSMTVVVMDLSGCICSVSPGPIDPGLDWWDAEGCLRDGCSSAIAEVMQKGEAASETVEVRTDTGSRSLHCTAAPLRERAGKLSGVVLILRDVTERKRLEHDLELRIAGLVSAAVS